MWVFNHIYTIWSSHHQGLCAWLKATDLTCVHSQHEYWVKSSRCKRQNWRITLHNVQRNDFAENHGEKVQRLLILVYFGVISPVILVYLGVISPVILVYFGVISPVILVRKQMTAFACFQSWRPLTGFVGDEQLRWTLFFKFTIQEMESVR